MPACLNINTQMALCDIISCFSRYVNEEKMEKYKEKYVLSGKYLLFFNIISRTMSHRNTYVWKFKCVDIICETIWISF